MKTFTVWSTPDGDEFTVTEGAAPLPGDTPGMQAVHAITAASWDDAMRQHHEWQGWEPYKPMTGEPYEPPDPAAAHPPMPNGVPLGLVPPPVGVEGPSLGVDDTRSTPSDIPDLDPDGGTWEPAPVLWPVLVAGGWLLLAAAAMGYAALLVGG